MFLCAKEPELGLGNHTNRYHVFYYTKHLHIRAYII